MRFKAPIILRNMLSVLSRRPQELDASLKVVGSIMLSQKDRLWVVEVGESWVVVGSGTNGLTTLAQLQKGGMPLTHGVAHAPFDLAALQSGANGVRSDATSIHMFPAPSVKGANAVADEPSNGAVSAATGEVVPAAKNTEMPAALLQSVEVDTSPVPEEVTALGPETFPDPLVAIASMADSESALEPASKEEGDVRVRIAEANEFPDEVLSVPDGDALVLDETDVAFSGLDAAMEPLLAKDSAPIRAIAPDEVPVEPLLNCEPAVLDSLDGGDLIVTALSEGEASAERDTSFSLADGLDALRDEMAQFQTEIAQAEISADASAVSEELTVAPAHTGTTIVGVDETGFPNPVAAAAAEAEEMARQNAEEGDGLAFVVQADELHDQSSVEVESNIESTAEGESQVASTVHTESDSESIVVPAAPAQPKTFAAIYTAVKKNAQN